MGLVELISREAVLTIYFMKNKIVAETGFVNNTMIRGENRYEVK
tara:strand:- start:107 stop:238 length:132 start_codon:yes stop_codon:yes gene_type:complete